AALGARSAFAITRGRADLRIGKDRHIEIGSLLSLTIEPQERGNSLLDWHLLALLLGTQSGNWNLPKGRKTRSGADRFTMFFSGICLAGPRVRVAHRPGYQTEVPCRPLPDDQSGGGCGRLLRACWQAQWHGRRRPAPRRRGRAFSEMPRVRHENK